MVRFTACHTWGNMKLTRPVSKQPHRKSHQLHLFQPLFKETPVQGYVLHNYAQAADVIVLHS